MTHFINKETLIWDGDAVPWWEMGGRRLVKGTQEELPTASCPETMFDALMDERHVSKRSAVATWNASVETFVVFKPSY